VVLLVLVVLVVSPRVLGARVGVADRVSTQVDQAHRGVTGLPPLETLEPPALLAHLDQSQ